jgi:hypothetical protein
MKIPGSAVVHVVPVVFKSLLQTNGIDATATIVDLQLDEVAD